MEKRIIYHTEVTVSNMMLEAEKGMEICSEEVKMVYLTGCISHYPTNTRTKYVLTFMCATNIPIR